MPKEGGRYDLPIAIGILIASQQVIAPDIADYELAAELSLSGELRPVKGILPFAIQTLKHKRSLIIAAKNEIEVALVPKLHAYAAKSLMDVVLHLSKTQFIKEARQAEGVVPNNAFELDLADVKGQFQAKRALEIAAAGGHNLLFVDLLERGRQCWRHALIPYCQSFQ